MIPKLFYTRVIYRNIKVSKCNVLIIFDSADLWFAGGYKQCEFVNLQRLNIYNRFKKNFIYHFNARTSYIKEDGS